MIQEDATATANSLHRTQRICRVVSIVFKIIIAIILTFFVFAFFFFTYSLVTPALFENSEGLSVFSLFIFSLSCLIRISFLIVLTSIFSDVAKGMSPFSMGQVKKLRIMSILLVLYFVLETGASFISVHLQLGELETGFFFTNANANYFVTVDFAPLFIAAAFLALSFVFKYGVLLQSLSDDTV